MLRVAHGVLLAGSLTFAGWACTVSIDRDGETKAPDDEPIIGASAGGETNIVSDGWDHAPVHAGNNMRMLNFAQMQSEVLRATTIAYDAWAENRVAFGAPDFRTSFQEDRTPTATKILTWRKIAFSVCTAMIRQETAGPVLFSSVAPTAAITAGDPKLADQINAVFTQFFLEPPGEAELEASIRALVDSVAAGSPPAEAWTTLCTAYLSSMRFLTY